MEIHHIFIFSANKGSEGDELVEFGLSEGSFRVHKGQGTKNRKFYFENFYLEILWVIDDREFKNPITFSAKLCERARYLSNGYSSFGLCLVNDSENDGLFNESFKYRPEFLPVVMSFDVITNEDYPYLPWTFRPSFRGRGTQEEPVLHKNGIEKLTKVVFRCPQLQFKNTFTDYFKSAKNISFEYSNKHQLILEFDNKRKGFHHCFKSFPLSIEY